MEPRDYAERIERAPQLPAGTMERFGGYGVMGLPFASGHLLAMRRFPASSVGPGYTSVWHRDPGGAWTFYTDVAALQSCSRYFGNEVGRSIVCAIELSWPTPRTLSLRIESEALAWDAEIMATAATRAMNAMARLMPDALWRRPAVLSAMSAVAGRALRAGRLAMRGRVPNGQSFIANPMVVWTIPRSDAVIGGTSLGPVGPLARQARLGDFWIPQRGLFVVGRAFFETFDPVLHLAVASQPAPAPE